MTPMIEATQEQLIAVFTEWKRRYDSEPEKFQPLREFLIEEPASDGEEATPYFLTLLKEIQA
jgi:hypothetical protein